MLNYPKEEELSLQEIASRWTELVYGLSSVFSFEAIRARLVEAEDSSLEIQNCLEELAFETHIDLGKARLLLLQLARQPDLLTETILEPSSSSEPEQSLRIQSGLKAQRDAACPCGSDSLYGDCCLRKDAVETFEKGKASGANLDLLFRQLEKDLDLEGVTEEHTQEPDSEPFSPPFSVLDLVQEFLWQAKLPEEIENNPKRNIKETEKVVLNFAKHVDSKSRPTLDELADIQAKHFTSFLKEVPPADRNQVIEALRDFCLWCEVEQEERPLRAFLDQAEREITNHKRHSKKSN